MFDSWLRSRKFLFLLFMALMYFLSHWIHWSDSEIWPIYLSQHLFSNLIDDSLIYKFTFYLSLKPLYSLPLSNIETFMGARLIYATIGIYIVYLLYQLANRIYKDPSKAFLTVILFVTCTFFMSRGFRVRADLLLCLFQLLLILFYFNFRESNKLLWIVAILLVLPLMLFSSPKVIFFLPVSLLFIGGHLYLRGEKKLELKIIVGVLSLSAIVTGLLFVFFFKEFLSAWSYFVTSYGVSGHGGGFFNIKSWHYVLRLFKENPIFMGFILASIYLSKRNHKRNPELIALRWAAMLSLIFIFIHSDRLPFFILALLPLPVILAGGAIVDLLKEWQLSKRVVSMLIMVLLAKASGYAVYTFLRNYNTDQVQAIQQIEGSLKSMIREPTIYDGLGFLPRYPKLIPYYITRDGQQSELDLLKFLESKRPEIVFFSNRMFIHFRLVMDYLNENFYIPIGNGIYMKGRYMSELSPEQRQGYSLYAGSDFMDLKWIPPGEAFQPKPLMLIAPLPPIRLPGDKSFARIFDYDSRY